MDEHIRVDLGAGRATVQVRDHHMKDYFTLENATVGGGPRPAPGIVSYKVEWTATGGLNEFDNPDQQFRGTFRNALAQMEWSARTPDYEFVSAPLATSQTDGAELGSERNGWFY
jgi:hypothetical protein